MTDRNEITLELEQLRDEKLNSLGLICYNQYIDGTMAFSEMNEPVAEIRWLLEQLMELRKDELNAAAIKYNEIQLKEKLTALGCICYNLYVDGRMMSSDIAFICNEVSGFSKELAEKDQTPAESDETKETPYVTETILESKKICNECGFENRSYAKFCGKCGMKL